MSGVFISKNLDEQTMTYQESVRKNSLYCRMYKKICPGNGGGCQAWKEWYVRNWNENINTHPEGRQKFQYEHPDLIREGIV
jgi:hypothetical protein